MPGSRVGWLLGTALAVAALAAAPAQATCGKHGWGCEHPGRAKHIILLIGDGMQLQHEIATSRYLFGEDDELSFHKFPYHVNISTWDVTTYNKYAAKFGKATYNPAAISSKTGYDPSQGGRRPSPLATGSFAYFFPEGTKVQYATDSASAATAWATGYKTDDGNVAWLPGDPQGGALKTVAEYLRELKGYAIGVVSTVPFTHATPAAHVSHNKSRNCYWAKPGCEKGIAEEILIEIKPEVVIGGGHPTWSGESYMSRALYDAFRMGSYASEYVFVDRQAGIDGSVAVLAGAQKAAAEGKKLFALFGGSGGNFESPEAFDLGGTPLVVPESRENPTLKEATLAALKVLSKDQDRLGESRERLYPDGRDDLGSASDGAGGHRVRQPARR
jgi:alkaline phosphatase